MTTPPPTSPEQPQAPQQAPPPPTPPRTPLWRLLRPLVVIGLVVVAGMGLVSAASWLGEEAGERFASPETADGPQVEPGQPVEVEIPVGSSAATIAEILEAEGVVRSAVQFQAAVRTSDAAADLRAGTYQLVTGMTPEEVIEILTTAPEVRVFDVTVREGLRVTEILDVLAAESGIDRTVFETALASGAVTTDLRVMPETPAITDWEGLLFPDTYRFSENASVADMLGRMANTMEERVAGIDWSRIEEMGYSIYEGIIVASLIEAEVRVEGERPLVASVIYNRLADGQRLEIDATVLYALGTREVNQFDRDLDSPYNTYAVGGLPPTPIAAPGLAALEAAANPADTDYRFYVLSSEDGSHTFSETFEEHQAARQQACQAGLLNC